MFTGSAAAEWFMTYMEGIASFDLAHVRNECLGVVTKMSSLKRMLGNV